MPMKLRISVSFSACLHRNTRAGKSCSHVLLTSQTFLNISSIFTFPSPSPSQFSTLEVHKNKKSLDFSSTFLFCDLCEFSRVFSINWDHVRIRSFAVSPSPLLINVKAFTFRRGKWSYKGREETREETTVRSLVRNSSVKISIGIFRRFSFWPVPG